MSVTATVRRILPPLAADVRTGLGRPGQKTLPPQYFYDELGTALYEAITRLPEYGLARAGSRLLHRHAEEVAALVPGLAAVAELGSGNGKNTRVLLEALARIAPVTYFPIDLSCAALEQCRRTLVEIEGVSVVGLLLDYRDGMREVARRRGEGPLVALFLGGTIGNLERVAGIELLRDVRGLLVEGDGFLLAADLEKPAELLLPAYDDPLGVTAAFNRNLLARINRELGADFDLETFEHVARYNVRERRIEMHLRSTRKQRVRIPGADLTVEFQPGETIWTESSHRFSGPELVAMGEAAGFRTAAQWIDEEWAFAHTLFLAR